MDFDKTMSFQVEREENTKAKEILKEEVKRGHAIANHTYGHDYSYLYPNINK